MYKTSLCSGKEKNTELYNKLVCCISSATIFFYANYIRGGSSGFNAFLGGGREVGQDKYARIEHHGFYWTATRGVDTVTALFL